MFYIMIFHFQLQNSTQTSQMTPKNVYHFRLTNYLKKQNLNEWNMKVWISIVMVQSSIGFVFQSKASLKSKDYRPQLFDKIQIHNTKPFMVTHVYSLFGFYGLVKTTNDWNQHMCILKLSVHDFYFFLIFAG